MSSVIVCFANLYCGNKWSVY